jgi:glycosyltransferase involved in cell wall biosynthesis
MWLGRLVIAQPAGGTAEVMQDGKTGYVADGIGEAFFDAVLERAWNDRANWPAVATAAAVHIRQIISKHPEQDFAQELISLAQNSNN